MAFSALRSGAFRFALALALVFAGGAVALLWVVERQVSGFAGEAAEAMLHGEATVLAGEYASEGRPGLLDALARHDAADRGDQFHYLLLDGDGRVLFGDLPAAQVRIGWTSLIAHDADDPSVRMREYGVALGGGLRLYVATDTFDVDSLRERLARFTMLSGMAISLFALVGGYAVGRVFLRRLERVNQTVSRIIAGDAVDRLPAIGLAPEFDALTRNLNHMLDRIAESMDGLRQVSSAIAHELRTPLMRLQQRVERMQVAPPAPGDSDAALAEIEAILATFQALLNIGMIEGGAGRARFAAVDLSALAEALAETYRPVAEDAGHAIVAQIAPGLAVQGEAQLLTQLFINLVENAIVHTPPGTTIALHIDGDAAVVRALVSDNGPGIAADEAPLLFRRFWRGAQSHGRPGSGLGLALVAAIAQLHGGEARVVPATQGLAIEVILPRAMGL